ncbi:uncharacterized protein LOC125759154 [Rhipicephalus sanguineus]|uniref:uncharacterized protein LOC125759154 n=1 Tax=Rhipicephalus sanguineus TaxID=34632 RepID=UPI0020C47FB4|nr:uncharacterized protein LOC125759154 [Rhipicephalus sanguineus]
MLRDQIVYGISSASLREKLLRKKDLTLVTAVEYCKAEELAESQNKAWAEENKIEPVSRTPLKKVRKKCRYCNLSHAPRKCPAYGKICNNCMKPNHFAACCTSNRAAVDDVVDGVESDGDFDVLEIRSTESKRGHESRDWVVTTNIEGKQVQLKVDTGAQANLLPRSLFNRLGTKQQPYPTRSILRHYGGGEIPHCGKVRLAVQLDKRHVLLEFFVVKKKQAILGLEASEQLGLVNRVNAVDNSDGYASLKQTYPRLFTGIGRTRHEYKMVLREDAVPVVQPTRRVPYALRKPLKKELDRMCAANIIEKVEEPSDWYVPGSKLVVADTLSRIPAQEHPGKGTTDVEIHAVGVLTSSVGPATLSRLQAATASDETLQDVISRLRSSISVEVSSPHFPKSNGLAEKGVQVVKRILDKTERSKEDFYLGLLNYRVCPLEDGRSPAELLMGRSLRTLLPDFSVSPPRPVRKHVQTKTPRRSLALLQKGDVVRVLNHGRWEIKAQVQDLVAPRSYTVLTEDGRVFRRNRQHLRKTPEAFCRLSHYNADDSDDTSDSSTSGAIPHGPEPPQATHDRPPAGTSGLPNSDDFYRRSTRPQRPPPRLAYTHGFQQSETA